AAHDSKSPSIGARSFRERSVHRLVGWYVGP
ncbi:MAG: hypothetical protein AVDCRST_MAG93-6361, partial [uncultured Chloroflexia bacterium]